MKHLKDRLNTFFTLATLALVLSDSLALAQTAAPQGKKTNLDFDGSVVEMVNRNGNNMSQMMMVGMDNSGKNGTLFHKKEHFRPEIQQNLKDMGDAP